MRTTKDDVRRIRQLVDDTAARFGGGNVYVKGETLLDLCDDADEADAMRAVLHSIATLDEHDTDDLVEALTNWDPADVYATLRAAINSARMALTRAEAEAAVDERLRADGVVLP